MDIFVTNQNRFNYWYTNQTGNIVRPPPGTPFGACVQFPPNNWNDDLIFADVGVIVHQDSLRDCAFNKLFSTEFDAFRTVLHETGHIPFGLADEYCCDSFYFQPDPHPNLYAFAAECDDDPLLGTPGARSSCSGITDLVGRVWWRLDVRFDHLMETNGQPRPTDIRRIKWMFGNCLAGEC